MAETYEAELYRQEFAEFRSVRLEIRQKLLAERIWRSALPRHPMPRA